MKRWILLGCAALFSVVALPACSSAADNPDYLDLYVRSVSWGADGTLFLMAESRGQEPSLVAHYDMPVPMVMSVGGELTVVEYEHVGDCFPYAWAAGVGSGSVVLSGSCSEVQSGRCVALSVDVDSGRAEMVADWDPGGLSEPLWTVWSSDRGDGWMAYAYAGCASVSVVEAGRIEPLDIADLDVELSDPLPFGADDIECWQDMTVLDLAPAADGSIGFLGTSGLTGDGPSQGWSVYSYDPATESLQETAVPGLEPQSLTFCGDEPVVSGAVDGERGIWQIGDDGQASRLSSGAYTEVDCDPTGDAIAAVIDHGPHNAVVLRK